MKDQMHIFKQIETIRKNQMEMLERLNTITEMKNALNRHSSVDVTHPRKESVN